MRKIALIQNDSELVRYSWADIRPMIEECGYEYDAYTAETLDEMFPRLSKNRYDAIIVASNACNDGRILDSLVEHRDNIASFLGKGNGLLVSFQMKIPQQGGVYSFLPDKLTLSARKREKTEDPMRCSLRIGEGQEDSVLVGYPNRLTPKQIVNHCRENNLVRGVYWNYLEQSPEGNYDVILRDDEMSPGRALLVASKPHANERVVVSEIAIDWQDHRELRENVFRYVVEGRPLVAVLSKAKETNFDYNYLVSTLETRRIPYKEYVKDELSAQGVFTSVHDVYILDPSWSPEEISRFLGQLETRIRDGECKVLYFRRETGELPSVTAVSNSKDYQEISRNVISWMIAKYPIEYGEGYWGGSFWCTVDVLTTLILFGVPVKQFRERIIASVDKHYHNGSYDDVLGATCAMYELLGALQEKGSARSEAALRWIIENVAHKTLFERATAYDVLSRHNVPLNSDDIEGFVVEVLKEARPIDNEIRICRYARTLLSLGRADLAEDIAGDLERLQNRYDGSWINLSNTASTIELLIDIERASSRRSEPIERMIFRGIEFIRKKYDHERCSWGEDLSATSKSIRALRAFEERITLPIGVMNELAVIGGTKSDSEKAVEAAVGYSIVVQKRFNEIAIINQGLEGEIGRLRKLESGTRNLLAACFLILMILVVLGLLLFSYAESKSMTGKVIEFLWAFTKAKTIQFMTSMLVVTGICIGLVFALRRLNRLPSSMETLLSAWFKFEEGRKEK